MRVIVVAAVVLGVFYAFFPGQMSQAGSVAFEFAGFLWYTLLQGFNALVSR